MKKKFFEKDEKDSINNIVIQQLERNDARTFYKIKKLLKFFLNLLTTKIKKF